MAFTSIKVSIWSVILSVLIYVLSAGGIGSDASNGPNKMSLTIQDTNDEDLPDYSPVSNQGIYLDKIDRLGALINPNGRMATNLIALNRGSQLSGYENHKKRQIRYHQCYFNPISCFRRRK